MIDRQGLHALLDVLIDEQEDIPEPLREIQGIRFQSGGGPGVYLMIFSCPLNINKAMQHIARQFAGAIPAVLADMSGVKGIIEVGMDGPVSISDKVEAKLKPKPPSVN